MGQINLFNDKVSKFYLGESDCRIYLGDTLLYPTETVEYMFTRTHLDGTTYGVECGKSGTDLTSEITLSGTTSIKDITDKKNPVTAITIGDCVTSIGDNAFDSWTTLNCELTLPSGLTSIGNSAFFNCSGFNGNIVIPTNLTSIGGNAFYNCSGLSGDIEIPSGVTYIGSTAFFNCSGFNAIYFKSETPPTLGSSVFNSTTCPIYVPCDSLDAYKRAPRWVNYVDRIKGAFYDADGKPLPDACRDDNEIEL